MQHGWRAGLGLYTPLWTIFLKLQTSCNIKMKIFPNAPIFFFRIIEGKMICNFSSSSNKPLLKFGQILHSTFFGFWTSFLISKLLVITLTWKFPKEVPLTKKLNGGIIIVVDINKNIILGLLNDNKQSCNQAVSDHV